MLAEKAAPRVVRFSVSLSRKVSINYSTYEVSYSESVDVPDELDDRTLAQAKHKVATRIAKQIKHELQAQFDLDPSA